MAATRYSESLTTHIAKKAGTGAGIEALQLGARVRYAEFSYTFTTAETAGTVIALTMIPKGARILGMQHQVSASTSTMTLAFGIEDADGGTTYDSATYAASLRAAAAYTSTGKLNTTVTYQPVATAGTPFAKLTEDVYVIVTTAALTAPATVLTGFVTYVDQMG